MSGSCWLILDNCEQIAGDVAEFVTALLERCFDLRVVATSRSTLGAPGEHVIDLAPLPLGAAEQLFLERAAAVVPGWTPDAEERAVLVRVCEGLDRLPLALELAAAQCRALSLAQVGEQLGDRFGPAQQWAARQLPARQHGGGRGLVVRHLVGGGA